MRSDKDPPRLLESAEEPVVRRVLGAARRDVPDDERMRMLSVALVGKLGLGGGGGSGGSGGPPGPAAPAAGAGGGATAGSSAAVVKATGVVLALALAGGALYAARPPAHRTEPPPVIAVTAEVAASPAPAPSAADAPAAAPSAVPTFSFDTLPSASAPKASSSAPASGSAEPSAESEMDLLRRAQDALSANPASALSLCGEHERSFARSSFAQEREVIAITALLRLGRRGEAEARADRFARNYPTSGHRRRIDALLGR